MDESEAEGWQLANWAIALLFLSSCPLSSFLAFLLSPSLIQIRYDKRSRQSQVSVYRLGFCLVLSGHPFYLRFPLGFRFFFLVLNRPPHFVTLSCREAKTRVQGFLAAVLVPDTFLSHSATCCRSIYLFPCPFPLWISWITRDSISAKTYGLRKLVSTWTVIHFRQKGKRRKGSKRIYCSFS